MTDRMACAYCSEVKAWPAAFPSTLAATCWKCAWDQHMKAQHPLPRAQRRLIKRRARDFAQSKLVAEAESIHAALTLASDIKLKDQL